MIFTTQLCRPDFSFTRLLRLFLRLLRSTGRFLESPGFYGKLIP